MHIECVAIPSLVPRPGRRRKKDIAHACANYPRKTWDATNDCTPFALLLQPRVQGYTDMTSPRTLARRRRVKKYTVVCGNPGFCGVVGACACNRYQALSPLLPPQRAWIYYIRLVATRRFSFHPIRSDHNTVCNLPSVGVAFLIKSLSSHHD